jgi:hypothetical protein
MGIIVFKYNYKRLLEMGAVLFLVQIAKLTTDFTDQTDLHGLNTNAKICANQSNPWYQ